MPTTTDQEHLIDEMVEAGHTRYWSQVDRAKDRTAESDTKHGRKLLKGSLEPYKKGIQEWIASAGKPTGAGRRHSVVDFIEPFEPERIAHLAAKAILDGVSVEQSYNKVCCFVGKVIEAEARYEAFHSADSKHWERLKNRLVDTGEEHRRKNMIQISAERAGISIPYWSNEDKFKVGAVLVHLFVQHTGLLHHRTYQEKKDRKRSVLAATDSTKEWIKRFHDRAEHLAPYCLPMIEPPEPWTGPTGGGYGERVKDTEIGKFVRMNKFIPSLFTRDECPEVMDAVNRIQATPWQINTEVLEVLEHFYEMDKEVAGLVSGELKQPPEKPEGAEQDQELWQKWKRQCMWVYKGRVVQSSKWLQLTKIIHAGKKFSQHAAIYFPHQCDFRGRTYPIPYYLNPQGSDIARGLLRFAEGKPIMDESAARWLAVNGANMWGNDKVSFEERIQWTEVNSQWVLNMADDPYECQDWVEADKPWQFLAWCKEWARWKRTGYGMVTHLPINLDASNNGLQILSLLTRDEVGGLATNCSYSEAPQDIYQQVCDVVLKQLRSKASTDYYAELLLRIGVNRKTTKRSVMTMPYGSKFKSCKEYIEEWLDEELETRPKALNDEIEEIGKFRIVGYLASAVWKAIKEVVGRPKDAMTWLQDAAKQFNKQGEAIVWCSPTGFPVVQKYLQINQYRTRTKLGDKIQYFRLTEDTDQVDDKRQINGISPNFVHSLDSAALHRTVNQCYERFGMTQFSMIHDSYGVLAPDVETMSGVLRNVYAGLFRGDLLEQFKNQLEEQNSEVELPELPEYGNLDPSEVKESEFFFA